MHAIITDGSISKYINFPKPLVIGDVQYPARIFSAWTASELAAIGIIEVTFDDSNKKDEQWYINTNQTYTYDADAGTVTATYGSATAKAIADVLFTQADEDNGLGTKDELNYRGLKYIKNQMIDNQCAGKLAPSDWRVIREQETGSAMDSDWKTWRAAVRTKCNSMQTQITNAANVDALAALFTYTTTDGVTSRPLGEFPKLEL